MGGGGLINGPHFGLAMKFIIKETLLRIFQMVTNKYSIFTDKSLLMYVHCQFLSFSLIC